MRARWCAATLALAFVAGGCGGGTEPGRDDGAPRAELTAEVASFDLSAGRPLRFLVGLGLFAPDGQLFVSGGTVDLAFAYLGEDAATVREDYLATTAAFLPIPGASGPFGDHPVAAPGSTGRGVYAAYDFEFDRPGFWEVEVGADVEGHGPLSATAAFEVLPDPLVPAPGDRAPRSENLTMDSEDAPAAAIDSRAATGDIPDAVLHQTTVARAIAEGRPALVVVATPVYCVSRFCGPVTDVVQELAEEYSNRAAFIHIEVWRDFEAQEINRAAADWIYRRKTLQEPWVFLIGPDGRVLERWDNVATRQEIEPHLQGFPPVTE